MKSVRSRDFQEFLYEINLFQIKLLPYSSSRLSSLKYILTQDNWNTSRQVLITLTLNIRFHVKLAIG